MAEEEVINTEAEAAEPTGGNYPEAEAISQTGYIVNPDGSVSSKAEAEQGQWDSK